MPIDGGLREKLATGAVLVAKYKGTEHRATVVAGEDGKRRFRLADGQEFKSPSSAGSAVMGGVACNGWRFWSLEAAPAKRGKTPKPAATAPEPKARPQCENCGKTFVSAQQLAHHEANADRLCRPA
jgi:hypothetical protein